MLQLSQNFFNFLAGQYTLLHVCRGGGEGVEGMEGGKGMFFNWSIDLEYKYNEKCCLF